MFKRIYKSSGLQIIGGTVVSLMLSLGSVWMAIWFRSDSVILSIVFVLLFFLSYATPVVMLALAMYRSFQIGNSTASRIGIILLSYISMIVVFAGVYFSMAFLGDYDYAVDHFFYYQTAGQRLEAGGIKHINPYPAANRAFVGMDERLWGTVDDYIPRGIYQGLDDIERYRARWGALLAFEGAVRFKRASVRPVLADCFHLSVMTITTVGYGDIAPKRWYAKLATDTQALTGTALLVVALGLTLSGQGSRPRSKSSDTQEAL